VLSAELFHVPKRIFPVFELKSVHSFSKAEAKLGRCLEFDLFKEFAHNQVLTVDSEDGFVSY